MDREEVDVQTEAGADVVPPKEREKEAIGNKSHILHCYPVTLNTQKPLLILLSFFD
jgi:hypothetical protein